MRDHLQSVFEQTGIEPEQLDYPPPSPAVAYLMDYFYQLGQSRQFGMTANPIAYSEILAWSQLKQIQLASWEVETLKQLDLLWLKAQAQAQDG